MIELGIDGYISKRGKGKSASYFVRNLLIAAVMKRMKNQITGY